MITGCACVYCRGLRVPDGVRDGAPSGEQGDRASALKPFGNAPETVILRRNRSGTLQKPCFCAETVRECSRNRVSTLIPFGNGPETVFLR